MQILETQRLILRQFTLDDAPFILELLNTPYGYNLSVIEMCIRLKMLKNYLLNGSIKSYAENGFGFYAVDEKAKTSDRTNQTIGMCGLIKRDTLPDIDIGFAFLPSLISKVLVLK